MNRTGHALSGIAGGLWSSLLAPSPDPAAQAVWVATCAGYALAPDFDHPGSSAARMWGPLTRWPARAVNAAFGHRGRTHRLVGATAATAGLVWAASWHPAAHALVVAVTVGLALTAFAPWLPRWASDPPTCFGLSWSTAGLAQHAGWPVWWLPIPAALGVLTHIVGDSLTTTGAPTRNGRWGLRLFRTGGPAEAAVCVILAALIAAYPYRGVIAAHLEGLTT